MSEQKIYQLPQVLVNQIAAGEVVERPASVVKELLENAIDAHSNRIILSLEDGGKQRIIVEDDGCGIGQYDLSRSIQPYMTSKIRNLNDLENVMSMGFRGEALASIASVSRVTITSVLPGAKCAYALHASGQGTSQVHIAARNAGTSVDVSNLYIHVPARRKFLKATSTELSHCDDVFQRIALAYPKIGFSLQHNGRVLREFLLLGWEARLRALFGESLFSLSEPIEVQQNEMQLTGAIVHPSHMESSTHYQFFYVNQRFVRDKLLMSAVRDAFSDVLHVGKQPCYALFLALPASDVDVNVHPRKTEVRFRSPQVVYQFIRNSIFKKLSCTGIESLLMPHAVHEIQLSSNIVQPALPDVFPDLTPYSAPSVHVVPFALAQRSTTNITALSTDLSLKDDGQEHVDQENASSPYTKNINMSDHSLLEESDDVAPVAFFSSTQQLSLFTPLHIQQESTNGEELLLGYAVACLQGIYVLAENRYGWVIVDVHAAHERILYESLKEEYEEQNIIQQFLILPIAHAVSPILTEVAASNSAFLKTLGIQLKVTEFFLEIQAWPALLDINQAEVLLDALLADIQLFGTTQLVTEKIHQVLSKMACHNAIRAGHVMRLSDMNYLLRQIEKTVRSAQCNHGRPTFFQVKLQDLDRLFMRGK